MFLFVRWYSISKLRDYVRKNGICLSFAFVSVIRFFGDMIKTTIVPFFNTSFNLCIQNKTRYKSLSFQNFAASINDYDLNTRAAVNLKCHHTFATYDSSPNVPAEFFELL